MGALCTTLVGFFLYLKLYHYKNLTPKIFALDILKIIFKVTLPLKTHMHTNATIHTIIACLLDILNFVYPKHVTFACLVLSFPLISF